jgi:hypothetical protein
MKIFRKVLRYWIALASVLSFLLGWVILAHSPKPVSAQSVTNQPSTAVLPNLPPIQAYNGNSTSNNGLGFFSNSGANAQANVQPSTSMPLLRTRGS